MATIIIKRTSEYNNLLRDYQILIDGKKIGAISNGQTKIIETTSGLHTITLKIDWCSSPEITLTLDDTERKVLTVGGFKNGNWLMPIAMGVIVLHFILQFFFNFNYGIIIVFPVFILLAFYLTIGRNKYLSLKEV